MRAILLRFAILAGGALTVGTCQDPTDPGAKDPALVVDSVRGLALVSDSSDLGAPGSRVVIALILRATDIPDIDPVALTGVLRWNSSTLRWVGQLPTEKGAVLVNEEEAASGLIRFAGYAERPAGHLAYFVLEATTQAPVANIQAEFTFAGSGGVVEVGPLHVAGVVALPSGASARPMTLADWMDEQAASWDHDGQPARVPGEGLMFGDPTVDGLIDARDVLYVSNMAVSNTLFAECLLRTDVVRRDCIAANPAPINLPGLGEAADACAPGIEVCGGFARVVDARDVLLVARESVGIDQPVTGELIPRPTIEGDTVLLASVTGTRTLSADTVYRLAGVVEVGTDGATGVPGELVIAPGTKIVAELDAALVVTRNGRIVAEGTAFQPITFDCVGAAFPGCWRGLRIHGNALVNRGSTGASPATIRGPGGCTLGFAPVGEGTYGGCTDADDSGSMQFVRVLNGGATSGGGVELRGVGSGTLVRQLYVTASGGDGVSVLGGTVRLREIRIQMPGARGLRWDEGWRGSLQYMVVQAGNQTQVALEGGSSEVAFANPTSDPVVRNVTLVAGPDAGAAPRLSGGVRLRTGTRGLLQGFLVVGQPHPQAHMLDVDGPDTFQWLVGGGLRFDSSLVAGYAQLGDQDDDPTGLGTLYSTDAEGQYLRQPDLGNRIVHEFHLQDSVLRGTYASVPDLRPVPNAIVTSTPCGTGAPPLDPAPYCGALAPPDMTLGVIPWMEPAPVVGTVNTPLVPTPGYAVIMVVGQRAGQPQFPLPGVRLGAGVVGATDSEGRYRTYVGAESDGGGASGFIITLGSLPAGCPNPGPIVNLGPPSGAEQVYGVLVPCL